MADHDEDYARYLQNVDQLAPLQVDSGSETEEEEDYDDDDDEEEEEEEEEKLVRWTDWEASMARKIMSGIGVKSRVSFALFVWKLGPPTVTIISG